jgi:hypothetical protein
MTKYSHAIFYKNQHIYHLHDQNYLIGFNDNIHTFEFKDILYQSFTQQIQFFFLIKVLTNNTPFFKIFNLH